MPGTTTFGIRQVFVALCITGASVYTAAAERDAEALKAIEERYQAERAACESGRTSQDRDACLHEAINARAAALRGQLDDTPGMYEENAVARCEALPVEERELCRRRALGEGENSGSVESGGILREYREITLPSVTPQKQTAPANGADRKNGK
ncbi:hypothetical protein GCM10027343_15810 [Noviherbaspirillum agri]